MILFDSEQLIYNLHKLELGRVTLGVRSGF